MLKISQLILEQFVLRAVNMANVRPTSVSCITYQKKIIFYIGAYIFSRHQR